MAEIFEQIGEAVQNGDETTVVALVDQAMQGGDQALDILEQGLIPGIQVLGKSFQDGIAYLARQTVRSTSDEERCDLAGAGTRQDRHARERHGGDWHGRGRHARYR